jgi:hypothetical protein
MACFIAGINPKGVASSGGLEIGDEILEVNIKQKIRAEIFHRFLYRLTVLYCMDDAT